MQLWWWGPEKDRQGKAPVPCRLVVSRREWFQSFVLHGAEIEEDVLVVSGKLGDRVVQIFPFTLHLRLQGIPAFQGCSLGGKLDGLLIPLGVLVLQD